jgi:hypothetical protein
MRRLPFFLAAFIAQNFLFTQLVQAQAASGADLDGDGSAEFVMIEIGTNSALDWSAFTSAGAASSVPSVVLGQAGDHIAIGNWASSTQSAFGYVRRQSGKGYWNVVNSQGQTFTRQFGGKNDVYVSGADFNANGFTDAAVVKSPGSGSQSIWVIKNDYFKHVDGAAKGKGQKAIPFGKPGDLFFYANYAGKADWIGALRKNANKPGSTVYLKSPVNNKKRSFNLPSYTPTTIRPLPVQRPGGSDLLALIRKQSSTTIFEFVSLQGVSLGSVELSGTGEVLVGNFLPAAGQEIALQNDDGFIVYSPHTAEQVAVSVPDGIAVDDVNINTFDSSNNTETCDDETLSPFDGSDKFLWKPEGEHSKKLVVLFPNQWTGKIDEVVLRRPDDSFIESASLAYIIAPGSRTFARFDKAGKKYPAGVKVVAHLTMGCYKTYIIENPAVRND